MAADMTEKPKIKEVIVVEGRDDTINVLRAVDCLTIETHGFGIKRETWQAIERAYEDPGIIILTDPDYSGNEIRRKLTERFPNARQAYILKEDALKKGDIGVENAEPDVIIQALEKCHAVRVSEEDGSGPFTMEDLYRAGLSGRQDSSDRRSALGKTLGIGYSNAKGLLRKLNGFGIGKEEFNEALLAIDDKRDQG